MKIDKAAKSPDAWTHLKEVVGRVLDTPPSEQEAVLELAFRDDPALLEEARRIIRAGSRHPDLLADPTGVADLSPFTPASDLVGEQIGPFTIMEQLGRGGFGDVYIARQDAPIARRVALKIIRKGMDSESIIARFNAERQALALMDHPNIAKVIDAGEADDGRPYFVMEYVDGLQITEFCDRHRLPIRERIRLLQQVCDAVQHAHRRGIIHRDIKPGNVLVTMRSEQPIPKVIDFGVAKAMSAPLTADSPYTTTTDLIGTPGYMAPEQILRHRQTDTRSDVYGLGVLLFELLSGTRPFCGADDRPISLMELQRKMERDDPPTPSQALSRAETSRPAVAQFRQCDETTLVRQLAGELDWIVTRAMARHPDDRYESPRDLADDLQRYLDGDAVLASPPSLRYRLGKLLHKYRVPVAAGSFALLALLFGLCLAIAGLYAAEKANDKLKIANKELADTIHALTREQERADLERDRANLNLQLSSDVRNVPAADVFINGDRNRRYFLYGPDTDQAEPANGYKLIVTLPGGNGSVAFHNFVRRIYEQALPDGFVIAQAIAPAWSDDQFDRVVWPTDDLPWDGMQFTTEQFSADIVNDIRTRLPIDPACIIIFGWSSGGPAAYASALAPNSPFTGVFAAMSVFRNEFAAAAVHRTPSCVVVLHSPDDDLIPPDHAQRAVDSFRNAGSTVKLIVTSGPHGWHDRVYEHLESGFRWIAEQTSKPRTEP